MVTVKCIVKVKFKELKASGKNSDIYGGGGSYNVVL